MFDWESQIKSQIEDFNRKLISQPGLMTAGQGYAEGGMPVHRPVGLIPGPVNVDTGDDTMTPTKRGEYILPVEAVLALGKQQLDKLVYGLKKSMGDHVPPRGMDMAGMMEEGEGYAEGGAVGANYPVAGTGFPVAGADFPKAGQNFPVAGQGFPTAGTGFPQSGLPQPKPTGYAEGGMTMEENQKTNPTGIPVPNSVAPSIAAEPASRTLFKAEAGNGQSAFTLTPGNIKTGLQNQAASGAIANGQKTGGAFNNSGDIASTVNEIARDGSGLDISQGKVGLSPTLRLSGNIDTGNAPVRVDTNYRREVLAGLGDKPFDQLSDQEKAALRAEGELDHRQFVDKPIFNTSGKQIAVQGVEATRDNAINGKHVDAWLGANPTAQEKAAVGNMFEARDKSEASNRLVDSAVELNKAKAKAEINGMGLIGGYSTTPFAVFYRGQKALGKTDDEISTEWGKQQSAMGLHGKSDQSDVEAMGSALANGEITMADITKRGDLAPKALAFAKKMNPDFDPAVSAADNKAFSSSIMQQQKQLGAMGSFVKNMDAQIGKVRDISKKLNSFDTRLLNMPLRAVRGRLAGSADQAKYDMYLTEIESEIGKLATGSAQSISELSVGAQEKWNRIHDKNLSLKDMLSLLEETSNAGKMRMQSVKDQLAETRTEYRNRAKKAGNGVVDTTTGIPQGGNDYLSNRLRFAADRGNTTPSLGKLTDANRARQYLQLAGGDANRARQLAQNDGWEL